ncbi:hypothetical protein CL649_03230 [bacterium]|nr:hypothetical protein [bacterium]|tara:strand:- start:2203 stop:2835 length:633 start_codon:yes stop_codon:yes gene_type:complete
MNSLTEFESKRLLSKFGLVSCNESTAKNYEEAAAAALEVGYPIVLKISGDGTEHKSELGGVKLGINNQDELSVAFNNMVVNNSEVSEFLICEHIVGKREFIAGYHIDKDFGPTIMFGLGGIFAEAISDASFRLLPCSREELLRMVYELKSNALLNEFRSEPDVDLEALADTLEAIAKCGLEDPLIEAIDVNPIVISGNRPVAVDALVIKS